jgi:hypothetical protein
LPTEQILALFARNVIPVPFHQEEQADPVAHLVTVQVVAQAFGLAIVSTSFQLVSAAT